MSHSFRQQPRSFSRLKSCTQSRASRAQEEVIALAGTAGHHGDDPCFRLSSSVVIRRAARVDLADSGELFRQFQRGRVLQVNAANATLRFKLDGTSALLPGLLTCVQQQIAGVGTSNPFATTQQKAAAPAPTSSNPFVTQQKPNRPAPSREQAFKAEAAIIAANMLKAGSIDGYTIGSPEMAAEFSAHAVWTAGAVVGTILIRDDVKADDPRILGWIVGEAAKSCKGRYASGSLPDADGDGILRLYSACQDKENSVTFYYLVVPRAKGGFYFFTTGSTGPQEALKEADSGLRMAVFKAIR